MKFSVVVESPIEKAFATFTSEFQSWWPSSYTLSQGALVKLGIEPKENGMCYEIGPHNFRCDWGRVLKWSPPNQLALSWQINQNSAPEPNPEKASELIITFIQVNAKTTRVDLEHLNIHLHGDGYEKYRDELISEYGWPYLLNEYKKFQSSP